MFVSEYEIDVRAGCRDEFWGYLVSLTRGI